MSESAPADDDRALIERVRRGEPECFHTLVSRYERGLYRTALAIVRSPADAEEVLQETFLRALRHLDQFRGDAKFQTWLTQITLNTARMKVRKKHAAMWESLDEPRPGPDGPMPRQVADWRENPEQEYGREQLSQLLHEALAGLPPAYRDVLMLRDFQMLSTQETAELLQLSIANVKTRLLRARLQLRERLAPHLARPARAAAAPEASNDRSGL